MNDITTPKPAHLRVTGDATNDLTADKVLAADDIKRERVFVPEWDGHVWVKSLTAFERDAWEALVMTSGEKGKKPNIRAALCVATICDKDGARLFTDNQMEELGRKSSGALDKCYPVAVRLSAVTSVDVEELEKN